LKRRKKRVERWSMPLHDQLHSRRDGL
jgi:hypothetical protein